MVILAVLIGCLALQPDLGGALTLVAVAMTMLFAAGTRLSHIISMILLAMPLLMYKLSRGYHKGRMEAWTNPWSDPEGKGFQIIQSWLALGTGGVFGQGLGEGKQKLFYLPEAHTDFILSVVGEELGFLGVVVIIGMFFLLVQRAMRISVAAPDTFGRFLALGIAVLFGIEATVNMGVVTGLLPTKGLALPFISYGGSSLLISLFAVGILLNISSGLKIEPINRLKEETHESLLIAGGGTGGHLFPGMAVAEEFLARDPSNEVLFVGTERGIEARAVPAAGYRLELITAAGIRGKGIFSQLKGAAMMLYGYAQSRRILKIVPAGHGAGCRRLCLPADGAGGKGDADPALHSRAERHPRHDQQAAGHGSPTGCSSPWKSRPGFSRKKAAC